MTTSGGVSATDSTNALFAGYRVANTPDSGDSIEGRANPRDGLAVSSLIGAFPWYWTVARDGSFVQGHNVFDLCQRAGMAWRWNSAAISQIALVGHTLGSHTLHPNIYRMPPDCRMTHSCGRTVIQSFDSFSSFQWGCTSLDREFCKLPDAFAQCVDSSHEPILSLSGGYDSRVLLALSEHFGCNPLIVTMGASDATDVKLARLLAGAIGKPLQQIEIRATDYLDWGESISYATSGVKTAGDWHTWLYNKAINQPTRTHLVGSNGEFARTFFSDAITRSAPFALSGRLGVKAWLLAKATNRFYKFPQVLRRTGLLRVSDLIRQPSLSSAEYPSKSGDCLDVFYALERVRHFIGSGLACYSQFSRPKSPFLHRNWIACVAALKRPLKLQNRFHRAVVDEFCPKLGAFPYNVDPDGTALVTYSPFNLVASDPSVWDLLVESRFLDHICSRPERVLALSQARHRRDTVSFLLTMHFAGMNAANLSTDSPIHDRAAEVR